MKKIVLLSAILIAFIFAPFSLKAEVGPKVIVVHIDSAQCADCQTIKPTLELFEAQHVRKDILFVTLDQSNENAKHQSILLADALGILDIYMANETPGKVLVIIDHEKQLTHIFDKNTTIEQMNAAVSDFSENPTIMMIEEPETGMMIE